MAGIDHGRPLPAVTAAMPRTLPSDAAFAKPGAGPECWPSSSRPSSWPSPSRSSSSSPGLPPSSSSTSSSQAAPSAAAAATAPLFPNAADDASPAGLSVAQLKGLPWFEYSGRSASPPWPPPDCAVCLEGFEKAERCRALPSCGHVFHVACVDRWLAKSRGCPICRTLVGVA